MGQHPYLQKLGSIVGVNALMDANARALATYASTGLDEDASLVECRRTDGGLDIVVVLLRAYPPQRPAADIRWKEEFAVVFTGEDRQPVLLALRPDFPDTPHQNRMPEGLPRYPCVDERLWEEAALGWTPCAYLERLRWWLGAAAMGELSGLGQVLDPLFVPSGLDLLVPSPTLADWDDGRDVVFATPDGIPEGELVCLHLMDATGLAVPEGKRYKVLLVRLPASEAGSVNLPPVTLAQLCRVTAASGLDLAQRLRDWVMDALPKDRSAMAGVMLSLPVVQAGTEAGRDDMMAFTLDITIGRLGAEMGLLDELPDSPGTWGRVVLPSPADPGRLESVRLIAMAVQKEFCSVTARECSGLAAGEPTEVLLVGAGALGSHLAMTLTREGRHTWTVADGDWLRPHNLARHALGQAEVGNRKARALATALAGLSRMPATPIVADVLRPGDQEGALRDAAARAACILDTSASVPVARRLSDWDLGPVRRVSIFLNPRGDAAVLLAEDRARKTRLYTLEAQYYRLMLRAEALAGHMAVPPEGFRYAGACRSASARIPESRMAALSGLAAGGFSDALSADGASIRVWSLAPDGSVCLSTSVPAPERREQMGEWAVLIDGELEADLLERRRAALPAETGGVLVGFVDVRRKLIAVVDALPPSPDSVGSGSAFTRGVEGLEARLWAVGERTGGMVRYVGEWHTHPRWSRAIPSSTDLEQLLALRGELRREGLPATMLIAGSDGVGIVQLAEPPAVPGADGSESA